MDAQHLPSLTNVTTIVGSVIAFAGKISNDNYTNPIEAYGWMLCDGRSLYAEQYPELYQALGDMYGSSGEGNNTRFNIPDLRDQTLTASNSKDANKKTINYLIKFKYSF